MVTIVVTVTFVVILRSVTIVLFTIVSTAAFVVPVVVLPSRLVDVFIAIVALVILAM
ncbi:5371_t:CDS:1, partial [Cetraspora pellucida]